MKICSYKCLFIITVICAIYVPLMLAQAPEIVTCTSRRSRCFLKKIACPKQCPSRRPSHPKAKACYIKFSDRKPSCKGIGAACYDPRFIGADGAVFYFHGKSNEHFSLVSDKNLQINARFIGHRPTGRTRDFTWIQALGVLFESHNFSVEAIKASAWDDKIDHLKFSFDGSDVVLPLGAPSSWKSEQGDVSLERVSSTNNAIISIPSDDCISHLEVQFRFFDLSSQVDGVLGRTYRSCSSKKISRTWDENNSRHYHFGWQICFWAFSYIITSIATRI